MAKPNTPAPNTTDPPSQERLTEPENEIIHHLGLAVDKLSKLDDHHPFDLDEFCHAIHHAQRIVICRAARRANKDVLR